MGKHFAFAEPDNCKAAGRRFSTGDYLTHIVLIFTNS
jgi:hypothetical protein